MFVLVLSFPSNRFSKWSEISRRVGVRFCQPPAARRYLLACRRKGSGILHSQLVIQGKWTATTYRSWDEYLYRLPCCSEGDPVHQLDLRARCASGLSRERRLRSYFHRTPLRSGSDFFDQNQCLLQRRQAVENLLYWRFEVANCRTVVLLPPNLRTDSRPHPQRTALALSSFRLRVSGSVSVGVVCSTPARAAHV
jgi:hypothetical protein